MCLKELIFALKSEGKGSV